MGAGASTNCVESIAKAKGDEAFRKKEYFEAVLHYTEAIESATHSTESFNLFESAVVFSNRSAAFYLCGQYKNALEDGISAVDLQPRWPKGYYRVSQALQKCDRLIEALDALEKALALAPEDSTVSSEMEELREHISKHVMPQGVGCLFSWGVESTGALGHESGGDRNVPTRVTTLARRHVVDVACGAMHTVAVVGTGEVYGWGSNKHGQVGVSPLPSQRAQGVTAVPIPRLIPGLLGVFITAVACGAGHTVVCARDGRVFSWGMGQQGQLGLSTVINTPDPVHISSLSQEQHNVAAVSCGIAHTFFLTEEGGLLACGQNIYGALGVDTAGEAVLVPTPVHVNFQEIAPLGASRIVHISCGGAHTAVVDSRGRLYTTGSNTCGQLGLSHFDDFVCSFSQVTSFVTEASVEVSVVRDVQTRTELYGKKELPVCAYVSCGEEFTAVISRQHSVYTVGLGLGGQLGLPHIPDKLHTFHQVATLEGKGIEEISCSQGTVFAVAESGDVYNWGVMCDQALSPTHSTEADVKVIPFKNSAFQNRKRARQITCGRKHYMLLTIAPYGPMCEPIKGLNSVEVLRDSSEQLFAPQVVEGESGLITVEAGKLFKFEIQSKDARGKNVTFGGAIVQGLITASNSSDDDRGDGALPYSAVAVEDNFDGVYSGDCRFFRVGECVLSVTLDGLHVMGSPFGVRVEPGEVYGPACSVALEPFVTARGVDVDDSHATSVGADVVLGAGKAATVWMKCSDKFGNMHPSINNTYVFIECSDEQENIIFNDCVEIVMNAESMATFEIVSPRERGAYFWRFGVGGMKDSQRIAGKPLKTRVIASQICPSRCEVRVPSRCVAGEAIIVTVILKNDRGKTVQLDSEHAVFELSSVLIPSSEYSICSRAIIQLYKSFGDILVPSVGQVLQSNESEPHHHVLEHSTRVAGMASLSVTIEGIVVYSEKIAVEPGETSPLFVELLGAGAALANWQSLDEDRLLMFQCNDKYGNARGVGGDVVCVKMWREGREHDERHTVSLTCHDQHNGFYDTHVQVIHGDIKGSYIMTVTVNDQQINYSPFSFNNSLPNDCPDTAADVLEVEQLQQEKIAARNVIKEKKKLAQIEQTNLEKFEKLRKQEVTNRRALEALRSEKTKRVHEKEERRLNRMSKRTGGGFIVQFSKDI